MIATTSLAAERDHQAVFPGRSSLIQKAEDSFSWIAFEERRKD